LSRAQHVRQLAVFDERWYGDSPLRVSVRDLLYQLFLDFPVFHGLPRKGEWDDQWREICVEDTSLRVISMGFVDYLVYIGALSEYALVHFKHTLNKTTMTPKGNHLTVCMVPWKRVADLNTWSTLPL
jgi:hypothetical protein